MQSKCVGDCEFLENNLLSEFCLFNHEYTHFYHSHLNLSPISFEALISQTREASTLIIMGHDHVRS